MDRLAQRRSGAAPDRDAHVETDPYFSPDGSQIAFTATVGGNTDVYVMPTAGGDPTRLTYHPGVDRVRGWTPGRGSSVVFASARVSPPHNSYFRLFTTGLDGGLPGAAADAARVHRHLLAGRQARCVRRGLHGDVPGVERGERLASLSRRPHAPHPRDEPRRPLRREAAVDQQQRLVPRCGSATPSTSCPIATSPRTCSRIDADTKELKQLTRHDDFDIMNASAGPDAIVYEQAGYIHLVDAKTGTVTPAQRSR